MFSTDRFRNQSPQERDKLLAEESYDLANDLEQPKQKPEVDKGQEFVDNMRKGRKILRFIKENNFQKGGDWIFPKNETLELIANSNTNPQELAQYINVKYQEGLFEPTDLEKLQNISPKVAKDMLLLKKMAESFNQVSSTTIHNKIKVFTMDGGEFEVDKNQFATNPRRINEQILKPFKELAESTGLIKI